jgi:hypothetical protein
MKKKKPKFQIPGRYPKTHDELPDRYAQVHSLDFHNELRKQFTFFGYLPDDSVAGTIELPDIKQWEVHTGVDWYGPRVRFIYDELPPRSGPGLMANLRTVHDEPQGWIKRILISRYYALCYPTELTPDFPRPRVLTMVGGIEGDNETGIESLPDGLMLEYFLDDAQGEGIKRLIARADELGCPKSARTMAGYIKKAAYNRNWNEIHQLSMDKDNATLTMI